MTSAKAVPVEGSARSGQPELSSGVDPALANLVRRIEEGNNVHYAPRVTLQVGGLVVTGTVTRALTWLGTYREAFVVIGDPPDLTTDELRGSKTDEFIHLMDAHVTAPGADIGEHHRGSTWRGRLSSVDGFFIEPSK